MPEEMGCQLIGAIDRLLQTKPLYDREIDAIQRRLFAFGDIMFKHNIGIDDVRNIRTTEGNMYFMGYLRGLISEFSHEELDIMFY